MDKAAKRLAVIYVILLSLCAPLMAVHFELFTWFMGVVDICLLYTSPSPRDYAASRMPSSA